VTAGSPRVAPGGLRDIGPVAWTVAQVSGIVTGTTAPNVFLVLGRNRRLFRGWIRFAAKLMPGGRLPRADSELVIIRVAHLAGSAYELEQHRRLGRRAGLSAEAIERAPVGPDAPGWTPRQQLLLTAVDELHVDRDLSDDTWAALREHLDEPTAMELVLLAGHYEMLATAIQALRVPADRPRRRSDRG
jgi:AhpD family alkylhydroperoxidase